MHRFSRLLFLALVISVGGLMAGTINFDDASAGSPGSAYPTASDAGVTVNFFVAPNGSIVPSGPAFGAVRGAPQTAFIPDDNTDGTDPTENPGFLTDEGLGPNLALDYLMSFSSAVPDLMLELLDYRVDGGPSIGDFATLIVYSGANWTGASAASIPFTIPNPNPADGNIAILQVLNPGFGIQSARVTFSTPDIGTGIDNVTWTSVPEPGTVALFGTGLLALAAIARRRRAGAGA